MLVVWVMGFGFWWFSCWFLVWFVGLALVWFVCFGLLWYFGFDCLGLRLWVSFTFVGVVVGCLGFGLFVVIAVIGLVWFGGCWLCFGDWLVGGCVLGGLVGLYDVFVVWVYCWLICKLLWVWGLFVAFV